MPARHRAPLTTWEWTSHWHSAWKMWTAVPGGAQGASRWMVPRDEGPDSIQESVPPHPATSPPRGLTLLVEGVLLTLCSYITAVL